MVFLLYSWTVISLGILMSSFDFGEAMDLPSSPISSPKSRHPSPNKRPRSPTEEGDEGNNSDDVIDPALRTQGPTGPSDHSAVVTSRNLVVFAKWYATKRKLNPQQVTEVDTFVTVRDMI
jgi:hypothetical protein